MILQREKKELPMTFREPSSRVYRIHSINRPGRLSNFGPGEWALSRGGRLLNFHHFQQV